MTVDLWVRVRIAAVATSGQVEQLRVEEMSVRTEADPVME